MRLVLGVDPGVISGWALMGEKPIRPLLWDKIGKRGKPGTGKDVAEVLAKLPTSELPIVLAIEGQFLKDKAGKGGVDRAKAVRTLITARHAGGWIYACQAHGFEIYHHKGQPAIPVNDWRSAQWGGRWTTEQAKKHAVYLADRLWGITVLKTHHHIAESMFIGAYAAKELEYREMQQRLKLDPRG